MFFYIFIDHLGFPMGHSSIECFVWGAL